MEEAARPSALLAFSLVRPLVRSLVCPLVCSLVCLLVDEVAAKEKEVVVGQPV